MYIKKEYICSLYLSLALMKQFFYKHWLVENMDNHLKKSELGRKELEISLKFLTGISGLHRPTLTGRESVLWRWLDVMGLEIRLGFES